MTQNKAPDFCSDPEENLPSSQNVNEHEEGSGQNFNQRNQPEAKAGKYKQEEKEEGREGEGREGEGWGREGEGRGGKKGGSKPDQTIPEI